MRKSQLAIPLLSVLALSISQVQAEENKDLDLEEVLIEGAFLEETLPQRIGQYGSRLDIIDAEEIQRVGSPDVAGALKYLVPGLFISSKNGSFDYVNASLQGSRDRDILWLVDGVRITNRLYAGTSPLDTLSSSIVERIEVLQGGQGIYYGTQAVAGVVNIVTKSHTNKTEGRFLVGGDSNEGRKIDGYVSGASGKNQYVLFGNVDKAKGFQPYDDRDYEDSATDRKRGYDVLNLGGKYAYNFKDARLSAFYQRNEAELDFSRPANNFQTINTRAEDLAYVKYEQEVKDTASLLAKVYYHNWDTRYTKLYNDPADASKLDIKNNNDYWGYTDYGATLSGLITAGAYVDYNLGLDYQRFNGSDDVLEIAKDTESVSAAFAEVTTKADWLKDTRLSAGIRHNKPSGDGEATVWQLTGKQIFAQDWFVRANLGTSFRLPSAYELYAIDSCCTQGNADLEPEKSQNANIAIGANFSQLQWEVVGFTRKVDNLISGVTQADDTKRFENINSHSEFNGAELNLAAQLHRTTVFNLNYVYTKAETKDGDKIENIPEANAKVSVAYTPSSDRFTVMLNGLYVGDLYDSAAGEQENIGNYAVLGLSSSIWLSKQFDHKLNIAIENLTNVSYETSLSSDSRDSDGTSYAYGTLGTPRTLSVSYSYNF